MSNLSLYKSDQEILFLIKSNESANKCESDPVDTKPCFDNYDEDDQTKNSKVKNVNSNSSSMFDSQEASTIIDPSLQ